MAVSSQLDSRTDFNIPESPKMVRLTMTKLIGLMFSILVSGKLEPRFKRSLQQRRIITGNANIDTDGIDAPQSQTFDNITKPI
jgi:hypothetical protein